MVKHPLSKATGLGFNPWSGKLRFARATGNQALPTQLLSPCAPEPMRCNEGSRALQIRPNAAKNEQTSKYSKLKKKKKSFKKWREFTGVSLMRPSVSLLVANLLDLLLWVSPPQSPTHRLTPLGLGGPSFGDSSTRLPKYAEHPSMSSAHQPHTRNFWLIPPLLDLDEIHTARGRLWLSQWPLKGLHYTVWKLEGGQLLPSGGDSDQGEIRDMGVV